jgi:hypothetical protein
VLRARAPRLRGPAHAVDGDNTVTLVAHEAPAVDAVESPKLIKGNVAEIDLADSRVGFQLHSNKGVGYSLVADQKATPLIGLARVKRKTFGGGGLRFVSTSTTEDTLKVRRDLLSQGVPIGQEFEFGNV